MKRQALAFLAVGSAMSVAACGNILGLKDLEPYPGEGGTEEGGADGAEESSPDSPAMGDDTSTHDAHEATTGDAREEDAAVGPDVSGNDVVTMDSPQDTNPPVDSPTSCEGGMVVCGGTCVNETSDGHNCGACGHDCLGGQCLAATCRPFLYASSTDAYDIIVVNDTLYWVDQATTVWTCSASAPASCTPTTLAGGQAQPTRITYDGTSCLFWTNNGGGTNGSIGSHQLGAATCQTVSSLQAPQGIAADATYIFWSDTGANTVTRLPRAGAPGSTAVTQPAGVALFGGNVYWADDSMSRVQKSPESTWAPTLVESAQSTPWAFGFDGVSYLYWVDFANPGAIWQTDGINTNQIAGSQAMPIRVAADSTTIYWANWGTNGSDGTLVSCAAPACTGTPKILENTLPQVNGLAITSNAVFYGTVGDHRLWRLAR